MNKEMLKSIMDEHGEKCKNLAEVLNMSKNNFSTIWNGRSEFNLKNIRKIAIHYSMDAQQIYDCFIKE